MGFVTTPEPSNLSKPLKPLKPPFDHDTAVAKARAGEDLWNTRAPERFRWDNTGPRPVDHPGLSELGL